jgi:peroxiredoxin
MFDLLQHGRAVGFIPETGCGSNQKVLKFTEHVCLHCDSNVRESQNIVDLCRRQSMKPLPSFTPLMSALAVATASFLVCAFGLSSMQAQNQSPAAARDTLIPTTARSIAPGFILTDAHGERIDLSDFSGKVVLLDFWATWCGGCKREIPWYMEFDKKFRGQGLAVIGVSMDEEGWKVVRPFLARKIDTETGGNIAMEYPVVIGNDKLAKEYNLTSMPMTLLIDREGRIALSHTGVVNKDDFQSHILQLLK